MPDIIDACRQADLRIYGFDGLKLRGISIQPFIEHSVDYSNIEDKQEFFRLSRDFILQKANLGLMFETVVEGDHD